MSKLPQALTVTNIKTENSYTKTFVLDGSLPARPGQFVMAWLPGFEDKPFSLAGADPVSLTIAAVGPLSRALHQVQVGDHIWVRGPLGRGYHLPDDQTGRQHVLLIGGGYGVAPLLFLAKQALALDYRVSMIIGAKSRADLLLADEFRAIGAGLWLTTEDGSEGIPGRVIEAIPQVLVEPPFKPTAIYSCGPIGMLKAIAEVGQIEQIPVQLAWEAHMRCGIGLCGSCEVGRGWLTCLDGPVFEFDPTEVAAFPV